MSTEYFTKNSHDSTQKNKIFGFWIYLMSDCIIFATLFATYAVMVNNTADGPVGKNIFKLPFILIETMILLISSISYGIAMAEIPYQKKNHVINWMALTFILGSTFIGMELYEFHKLIIEGFGPSRSGFLSGFFTLIGTHGLHVFSGLIWMLVLIFQIYQRGLTITNQTRMMCLSLFWHFLDIIWICVFTVVYLIGSI
ncbi:cytochrome o ubiquinol oxidase subunit III [Pantoea sp. Aalb]|uniref:cytochrome o ubiquinol oxidase subunit III n=1 Tax=Pantoea sp. Aalb TaxID=2576762 RepID=UPI001329CC69|nr:cytochrome o ubiquinol oxidase subunit III [Pantoea sp. Aalb]MXP67578.1 cytochrome o ubiquinol oxidase subunit III [Pantoea sp. Aalb]